MQKQKNGEPFNNMKCFVFIINLLNACWYVDLKMRPCVEFLRNENDDVAR